MTSARLLIGTLLIGAAAPAGAACDNPPLAQVPTRALDDRAKDRVRADVEEYFEAMKVYTACIQAELQAAGGNDAPELTKTALVLRNNVAVAEAEAVLKLFTEHFAGPPAGPPEPAPRAAPAAPQGRDRD